MRAEVEAAIAQQQQALLAQLVQRLLAVPSSEALLAFWRELPAELEEPLAAAAEEIARQAEQSGDAGLALALRERAAGLRAIIPESRITSFTSGAARTRRGAARHPRCC